MAGGAITSDHTRVGTVNVIQRSQLQRRAAAHIKTLASVMAGVAGAGDEGVRSGAHGSRWPEAAGIVGRSVAGAAIGTRKNGNMRWRKRRRFGRRNAGN